MKLWKVKLSTVKQKKRNGNKGTKSHETTGWIVSIVTNLLNHSLAWLENPLSMLMLYPLPVQIRTVQSGKKAPVEFFVVVSSHGHCIAPAVEAHSAAGLDCLCSRFWGAAQPSQGLCAQGLSPAQSSSLPTLHGAQQNQESWITSLLP